LITNTLKPWKTVLILTAKRRCSKLYASQRKIRWVDSKRRELTGGGLPKAVVDALKSADPEVLKTIAESLGV